MKNKEGLLQRGGNSFQAAWDLGWWGAQGEGLRVTFPIPRFGNVGPPHPSGQEVPPRCLIPCVQSAQAPTILNKPSYSLFPSLPWLRGGEGQRRMKKRGFWEKRRVKGAQEPGTIQYRAGSLDRSRLPSASPVSQPASGLGLSSPHP